MPGFLRKKPTLSRRVSPVSTDAQPEKPSDDAPPSLPPLLLSSTFADPEPDSRAAPPLPPAASPPVVPLQTESTFDDAWDPWKAYVDAPRSDSDAPHPQNTPRASAPPAVQPAQPSAGNASVDVPNTRNAPVPRPIPVATAQSPRRISLRPAQTRLQDTHPKCDALGNQPLSRKQSASPPASSSSRPSVRPPAVVRGQMAPTSTFDFEESLSAANVTSVVNQFRSYPPPIRHHTSPAPPSHPSQMDIPPPSSLRHHIVPQKPGSSSSLSYTSHHADAARRTDGSYSTSTSASPLSHAAEVIDVRTHKDGRLDPPRSGPGRSHFEHSSQQLPSLTSRPSTSPSANPRAHRSAAAPSVPPTSYPDRPRTVVRQTSQSSLSSSGHPDSNTRTPMLYDLRSGNSESGPLRKGPLIFAAMPAQPSVRTSASDRNSHAHNPYSSPPVEYASLEPSPSSWRNSAFRGAPPADLRSHEARIAATELPPLNRKSSKSSLRAGVERTLSAVSRGDSASEHHKPRVLTKARPTTPQRPSTASGQRVLPGPGDSLFLDDDPFARVEGIKLLKPRTRSSSGTSDSLHMSKEDISTSEDGHVKLSHSPSSTDDALMPPGTPPPSVPEMAPLTPPDDYKAARQLRRGLWLEKAPPPAVAEVLAKQLTEADESEPPREPTPPPTYFPIMAFMSDPDLLPLLLSYLSYSEWLVLYSATKEIQELFQSRILREFVLQRYLGMVGYSKWNYEWAEPLALSLKDLHNYLRGVAMPSHQYARLATTYLQPQATKRDAPISDTPDILTLAHTTRAYTRVVLRLRTQAESEAKHLKMQWLAESAQAQTMNTSHPGTRQHSVSSRAASPTSSYSHSRNHSHGKNERSPSTLSPGASKFKSPLYRLGRAPVLRVFVPSPEGDWLSDASVVECEAELKRSGVLKLLRVGDVVWDVAVGDEGNLGRLIWDGSYLVDLDYGYSRMGELSPYFHSLAFAPSYFHRVIRVGASATYNPHCNPIVHIDVRPWGREIAANLQLLQDRARTETPHGALHDVVRWVHRSTFTIRPPLPLSQGQIQSRPRTVRIPIPNIEGLYIDPGWYGTVVLESEGTNEGLADLQARCGPGVFPPRAETLATKIRNEKEKENRRVWRILREKSRPGEIWLRAVQVKERLM